MQQPTTAAVLIQVGGVLHIRVLFSLGLLQLRSVRSFALQLLGLKLALLLLFLRTKKPKGSPLPEPIC